MAASSHTSGDSTGADTSSEQSNSVKVKNSQPSSKLRDDTRLVSTKTSGNASNSPTSVSDNGSMAEAANNATSDTTSSALSKDSPPFNPSFINNGNEALGNLSPLAQSNAVSHKFQAPSGETVEIRNVWAENVDEEMENIRELIETHPYVAMDTEFPGVVARPISGTYAPDFQYKSLKCNVDLLKIIQLGLSFGDEDGNFAKGCPCWQFNFKFDMNDDMFAQDSIDLLVNSGISFTHHASRGIDPHRFGELLIVSGLVLDDRVKWVSFHSGYDYGYLLKILTTIELPNEEKSFFNALRLYFPNIYDIKYMTSLCDGYFGGLQKLADDLGCTRIGQEHQAGSDSLLTMTTYFELARLKFLGPTGDIDDGKYRNELFGYGNNHTAAKGRTNNTHQNTSNGHGVNGCEQTS